MRNFKLSDFLSLILQAMSKTSHTDLHALQVAYISGELAKVLYSDNVNTVVTLAFLHDVGFLIPRYLRKVESLALEDLSITIEKLLAMDRSMKRSDHAHAILGEKLVRHLPQHIGFEGAIELHHTPAKYLDESNASHVVANIINLADVVSLRILGRSISYGDVRELVGELAESEDHFSRVRMALKEHFNTEVQWFALTEESALVEKLMDSTSNEELNVEEMNRALDVVVFLVDHKSPFTRKHTESIAYTAPAIASEFGFSENEKRKLEIAAKLHDIGKLATPLRVLEKPGKLDSKELWAMRKHVYLLYLMLGGENACRTYDCVRWAVEHHERLDGSGYPFKKTKEELSLPSRILMVADMLVAMMEDRPYRPAMSPDKALEILKRDARDGKLDPLVVGKVEEMVKNGFNPIVEEGVSERILSELEEDLPDEFGVIRTS